MFKQQTECRAVCFLAQLGFCHMPLIACVPTSIVYGGCDGSPVLHFFSHCPPAARVRGWLSCVWIADSIENYKLTSNSLFRVIPEPLFPACLLVAAGYQVLDDEVALYKGHKKTSTTPIPVQKGFLDKGHCTSPKLRVQVGVRQISLPSSLQEQIPQSRSLSGHWKVAWFGHWV